MNKERDEVINSLFRFRLKALRKGRGIKQGEFAKMVNISQSMLSKYEVGTASPSIYWLIKFAQALNTTVDYLLGVSCYNLHFLSVLDGSGGIQGFLRAAFLQARSEFPELKKISDAEIEMEALSLAYLFTNINK